MQIRAQFQLPDDLTEEEKLEPVRNFGDDPKIRLLNASTRRSAGCAPPAPLLCTARLFLCILHRKKSSPVRSAMSVRRCCECAGNANMCSLSLVRSLPWQQRELGVFDAQQLLPGEALFVTTLSPGADREVRQDGLKWHRPGGST